MKTNIKEIEKLRADVNFLLEFVRQSLIVNKGLNEEMQKMKNELSPEKFNAWWNQLWEEKANIQK